MRSMWLRYRISIRLKYFEEIFLKASSSFNGNNRISLTTVWNAVVRLGSLYKRNTPTTSYTLGRAKHLYHDRRTKVCVVTRKAVIQNVHAKPYSLVPIFVNVSNGIGARKDAISIDGNNFA